VSGPALVPIDRKYHELAWSGLKNAGNTPAISRKRLACVYVCKKMSGMADAVKSLK